MSYNIFGYVKIETQETSETNSCETINAGFVKPYFKKVDSGSSSSKLSDISYKIETQGYYSFDIEDNNLLGVFGTYKKTKDKFYVMFYYNELNPLLDDLSQITHCAFIETQLENTDNKRIDILLQKIRKPIFQEYFLPDDLFTQTEYNTSQSSFSDYSWLVPQCNPSTGYEINQSQKLIYDGVQFFENHFINKVQHFWGENVFEYFYSPQSIVFSKSTFLFDKAQEIDLKIIVFEKSGSFNEIQKRVKVKYNDPVIDFEIQTKDYFNQEIQVIKTDSGQNTFKGQSELSFIDKTQNKDLNQNPLTYKWIIKEVSDDNEEVIGIFENKTKDFIPTFIFNKSGKKIIELNVYYNNGFEDLVKQIKKEIFCIQYDISIDFLFNQPNNRNDDVYFLPIINGDINSIESYEWVIEDNYPESVFDFETFDYSEPSFFGEGSPDKTKNIDNTKVFFIQNPVMKFHSINEKNCLMKITYYDGFIQKTKEIKKTLLPNFITLFPEIKYNLIPQNRFDEVTFELSSLNPELIYYVSWTLNDFKPPYCIANNTNDIIDETSFYEKIDFFTKIKKCFNNQEANKISVDIWYDNGYQKVRTQTINFIQPKILETKIIPDFEISNNPRTRFDEVKIINTSKNFEGTPFIKGNFVISDSFDKTNPNNIFYDSNKTLFENQTNQEIDNTKSFLFFDLKSEFSHFFQKQGEHEVLLQIYYDDGFYEQVLELKKFVFCNEYIIEPNFNEVPLPINNGWVGKQEISFINKSKNFFKEISIDWFVFDKGIKNLNQSGSEISDPNEFDITIYQETNQLPEKILKYEFQSCSRVPSEPDNLEKNRNKEISMKIKYDNGFCISETSILKKYEAKPKTVYDVVIDYSV